MTTPTELPRDLPPEHVSKLLAEGAVQVVDVREPYEREAGHVRGSRHVPLEQLSGAAQTIDPTVPVVFVCRVGARSAMAAGAFVRAGVRRPQPHRGMVAWAAGGAPARASRRPRGGPLTPYAEVCSVQRCPSQ